MELEEERKDGTYHVHLKGQFTYNDHKAFRKILKTIEEDEPNGLVILYMKALEFVDSSGLGMLLLAHDAAEKKHKKLILKNVTGQVQRMFELAHFQKLFAFE